jgi:hypothetical protein
MASAFDPRTAGGIRGQVVWRGAVPSVPAFEPRFFVPAGSPRPPQLIRENPNAPVVDAVGRGVGNAVVFLRGLDPRKARPWNQPPVRVEQRDWRLHLMQGETDSRVGFVRRGQPITVVSKEPRFHALHAGGAAFFSLTFPDPEQLRSRRLPQAGLVELSSAAGYYWMRAYLFVDDHSYYVRTDAQGRFVLQDVPAGRYQLVCWLPNWRESRHERDPETGLLTRLFFAPPLEQEQTVVVQRGRETTVAFTVGQE